jgi:peptide deformylase
MILKIETDRDNPILRKKSEQVREITKKTLKLIKDMQETMLVKKGVGLAAPQVGINERIILITLTNKKILPMINPRIIGFSKEMLHVEEGCLSLPGIWGKVKRAKEVTVEFENTKGQKMMLKFSNFESRELQHEIDHLDGVLFTDYLDEGDILMDDLSVQQEVERI